MRPLAVDSPGSGRCGDPSPAEGKPRGTGFVRLGRGCGGGLADGAVLGIDIRQRFGVVRPKMRVVTACNRLQPDVKQRPSLTTHIQEAAAFRPISSP